MSNALGLPFFAVGPIVQGFGRGSKELGIPTANYPLEVVKKLPTDIKTGVYYGWANVDGGEVHKMVMSIGWNPFYHNTEKSMETHIIHEFGRDLYDCTLKVIILGYIRPEKNFDSLQGLIDAINNDISTARELLEHDNFSSYRCHDFFTENNNDS